MIQRVDRWKTYHQDNNTVIEKHKSSLLQFLDPSRDKKWKRKKIKAVNIKDIMDRIGIDYFF